MGDFDGDGRPDLVSGSNCCDPWTVHLFLRASGGTFTACQEVRLESPDLLPVGSTGLAELSLAVPAFHGPGRYDLCELAARSDAGEIESFDALEMYLNATGEADERIFYVDVYGDAPVVEVTGTSLSFDLPMASAVGSIRASGTIAW